ncbi:MAG: EVE domain-containing protein [Candidatus Margulisiibacteriota bacterium]
MKYWLLKTEPGCYSIADLKRDKATFWDGIRNYQARNFMRDAMSVGDLAFFYHSNAEPSGIAGICKVVKAAHPDFTAWEDPNHDHFDPKSTPEKPIWEMVDVGYVSTFSKFVSLSDLRQYPELANMVVLQKGSRLSVQPVTEAEFKFIETLGKPKP